MGKVQFDSITSIVQAAAAYGTTVSYGAANTKGAYTQVVAAASIAASAIVVTQAQFGGGGEHHLIDIATGAAGAESVLVANLATAGRATYGANAVIPVAIPSGARIAVRGQRANGNNACKIGIELLGGTAPTSSSSETWGAVTASSQGTSIDPGAVVDTKGAWTQLVAASGLTAEWLIVMLNTDAVDLSGSTAWSVDIGIGAGGAESVVIPDIPFTYAGSTECQPKWTSIAVPTIASGTRVAVRAQCSSNVAADRLLRASIVAVARAEPAGGGGSGIARIIGG